MRKVFRPCKIYAIGTTKTQVKEKYHNTYLELISLKRWEFPLKNFCNNGICKSYYKEQILYEFIKLVFALVQDLIKCVVRIPGGDYGWLAPTKLSMERVLKHSNKKNNPSLPKPPAPPPTIPTLFDMQLSQNLSSSHVCHKKPSFRFLIAAED